MKFIFEINRFYFEASFKGGHVTAKRTLPDQVSVEAFILTFRFFIQNNEKCSFGNLDKVHHNLSFSPQIKKRFFKAIKVLNQGLDSKIIVNVYGETPTKRRLLDIFIYGGLAHANPEKKKIYDQWKKHSIIYGFLAVEFCSILEWMLRIIGYVVDLNKKALSDMLAS